MNAFSVLQYTLHISTGINVKLFLMRHGEASLQAPSDMQRPLTERGVAQIKAVIEQNVNDLSSIKTILASPYLRAQQTAQIVSDTLGLPILTMASITPDGNPRRVCDSLFESAGQFGNIILITHMPFVGDLSSLLVSDDLSSPDPFTTSQIVLFEAEHILPGCMSKKKVFLPS